MIRLGIDAMGGDFAPENVILGAIDALSCMDSGTELVLIGDSRHITEVCRHYGVDSGNFVIVNASQRIEMGERPVEAYNRKSDSSINIGFRSLAEGWLDAFASAGNTGAMLFGKDIGAASGNYQTMHICIGPAFQRTEYAYSRCGTQYGYKSGDALPVCGSGFSVCKDGYGRGKA